MKKANGEGKNGAKVTNLDQKEPRKVIDLIDNE